MTPEVKMQFIVFNTKQQDKIINAMYSTFNRKLYLWRKVNKELSKMPELFSQIKAKLDEWKSRFLLESSFYPKSTTPMESLDLHSKWMERLEYCIVNNVLDDDLPDNFRLLLEDASGILLEMEILLPSDEEISNGYK